jgi:hypothetical protein
MDGSRLVPAKYRIRSSHTLLPITSRWLFLRSWRFFSYHHLNTGCQMLGLVSNENEVLFQRQKDGRSPTDKHHPSYANIKMQRAVPPRPYNIPKNCYTSNYTIVRTVNEHNKYGMVLQMYLTIHKYSIATNVIYSNNNYMFRPRGAIIRLCNRILNRLYICGHF